MTEKEIQKLINISKERYKKDPKKGYKKESGHKKCNLDISISTEESTQEKHKTVNSLEKKDSNTKVNFEDFKVFIRQNQEYIENFSIGLIYKASGFPNGLCLIRYNGPHDSKAIHHLKPHIHKMTAKDITSNLINPRPTKIETTDKYNTLEEGLSAFFEDIKISNWREYFPELEQRSFF